MILPPPVITDSFFSDAWNKLQRSVRGQEPIAAPGILTGHTIYGVSRESEPGPRPYGQAEEEISSPILQFKIISIAGNHLVCQAWDGTNLGITVINVARPPKLRRSVTSELLDGRAIVYDYTSDVTRVASWVGPPATFSNQVIVPRYLAGDIIYAVKPDGGTGAQTFGNNPNPPVALEYVDLNVDGRAWAKTPP